MKLNLAVTPGDGIGPDVMVEGVKVLQAVASKFGHQVDLEYGDIGGVAIGGPAADETRPRGDVERAARRWRE